MSEPADPVTVPQTRTPINVTNVATATAPATNPPGNIPDLTTMSDHDLISYINPSCFDQGAFTYDP